MIGSRWLTTKSADETLSKKRSLKKRQAGQAVVEFALIIIFLIVFLLSFLEVVAMLYTYSALADAAKEGVRYGVVHGTSSSACSGPGPAVAPATCDATAAGVTTAVTTYANYSLHGTGSMTITPTYPDGTSTPSSRIRVVVSYPYQAFFGLGWPTITVNAASEGRILF
jgi:Flp pilus assembly protein TadG